MLTHIDKDGNANMVDVTNKEVTSRTAKATATVCFSQAAFEKVMHHDNPKGDVFATARIAGIQAAKKCSDLIPLCHPLMLSSINIEITPNQQNHEIEVTCQCKLAGKTGVEMEALTGASVAALTIYDMCKAIDKGISITNVKLLNKSGGKSGTWSAGNSTL